MTRARRSCPGSIRLLIQRPLSSSPLSPPPSPPASTTTTTTSSAQAEDLSGSGVGSGYDTLKRRRRRRSSTTGESGGEDDRVATPQKPFRGYISWNVRARGTFYFHTITLQKWPL